LADALRAHRHLRSERVFCQADGTAVTRSAVEAAFWYACKRVGLRQITSHTLRHTFCSHLGAGGTVELLAA
jgi:site-specific recombinase XerD